MKSALETAVAALLEDLLDPDGTGGLDAAAFAAAVQDLLGKLAGMPRYLGVGMVGVTLCFDAVGGPHHRRPVRSRSSRLHRWRRSPIGGMRSFVDFYEKMGTFAYYAHFERLHPGFGE